MSLEFHARFIRRSARTCGSFALSTIIRHLTGFAASIFSLARSGCCLRRCGLQFQAAFVAAGCNLLAAFVAAGCTLRLLCRIRPHFEYGAGRLNVPLPRIALFGNACALTKLEFQKKEIISGEPFSKLQHRSSQCARCLRAALDP